MAELIWDGKYDAHGNKRAPVRIELPFQTVETVNESAQEQTFHSQYSKEDDNTKNYIKERFIFDDGDGRKYMKSPLINPLPRPNLRYSFRGVQPPPTGWLYSKQK